MKSIRANTLVLGTDPTGHLLTKGDKIYSTRLFNLPWSIQFGIWFSFVFALKASALFEPPVWDSAMGVFPPAIYLYETNFDILALLQENNWWQGGPNVHSLSIYTWLIAGVMTLTDSAPATFAVMHVTTFALFSWSITLFTRVLLDYGLHYRTVIVAAVFLVLMPLVLVQVGYLYTEIPVLVLGVAAWANWHDGKPGLAVLFCALGLFVKLTALAITLCIGILLLWNIRPINLRKVLLIGILPTAFCMARWGGRLLGGSSSHAQGWGDPAALLHSLVSRLTMIPDVTLLLIGGMFCACVYVFRHMGQEHRFKSLLVRDPSSESRLLCLAMPFVFLGFVVAMAFKQTLFLPRYLVPVIPFALVQILLLTHYLGRQRFMSALLIAGCAFSVANTDGRLYRPELGRFSIVERSHAYHYFHELQINTINALLNIPKQLPTFVSREIDYMTSSSLMGYVDTPLPHIEPIYSTSHRERSFADFPEEFLLVHSNPGHGGQEIARLVKEAERTAGTGLRVQRFENQGFHAEIYWIRKGGFGEVERMSAFTDIHANLPL